MKKIALNIWAAFAQKLGLTPQETEDVIFKEIIRRQNLPIKSIDKAKNVVQLENIERTISLYIDAEFCDYPHLIKEPYRYLTGI